MKDLLIGEIIPIDKAIQELMDEKKTTRSYYNVMVNIDKLQNAKRKGFKYANEDWKPIEDLL